MSKTVVQVFSYPYYFFSYKIIINNMRLACVRAAQVAYVTLRLEFSKVYMNSEYLFMHYYHLANNKFSKTIPINHN